jgi:hypothetical protein
MKWVRPRNRNPFYTNIMSSVPVPNTFVNESVSRFNPASDYDTPALTKFKEGLSVFEDSSKYKMHSKKDMVTKAQNQKTRKPEKDKKYFLWFFCWFCCFCLFCLDLC